MSQKLLPKPIVLVFTDDSSNGMAVKIRDQEIYSWMTQETSAQQVASVVDILIFSDLVDRSFNLYSYSQYIVK